MEKPPVVQPVHSSPHENDVEPRSQEPPAKTLTDLNASDDIAFGENRFVLSNLFRKPGASGATKETKAPLPKFYGIPYDTRSIRLVYLLIITVCAGLVYNYKIKAMLQEYASVGASKEELDLQQILQVLQGLTTDQLSADIIPAGLSQWLKLLQFRIGSFGEIAALSALWLQKMNKGLYLTMNTEILKAYVDYDTIETATNDCQFTTATDFWSWYGSSISEGSYTTIEPVIDVLKKNNINVSDETAVYNFYTNNFNTLHVRDMMPKLYAANYTFGAITSLRNQLSDSGDLKEQNGDNYVIRRSTIDLAEDDYGIVEDYRLGFRENDPEKFECNFWSPTNKNGLELSRLWGVHWVINPSNKTLLQSSPYDDNAIICTRHNAVYNTERNSIWTTGRGSQGGFVVKDVTTWQTNSHMVYTFKHMARYNSRPKTYDQITEVHAVPSRFKMLSGYTKGWYFIPTPQASNIFFQVYILWVIACIYKGIDSITSIRSLFALILNSPPSTILFVVIGYTSFSSEFMILCMNVLFRQYLTSRGSLELYARYILLARTPFIMIFVGTTILMLLLGRSRSVWLIKRSNVVYPCALMAASIAFTICVLGYSSDTLVAGCTQGSIGTAYIDATTCSICVCIVMFVWSEGYALFTKDRPTTSFELYTSRLWFSLSALQFPFYQKPLHCSHTSVSTGQIIPSSYLRFFCYAYDMDFTRQRVGKLLDRKQANEGVCLHLSHDGYLIKCDKSNVPKNLVVIQ